MKQKLIIAICIAVFLFISREAWAQTFYSKHRFTNTGYDDEATIKIRLAYGKTDYACDTLFIGKEVHYILACGTWNGWTKWDKRPKNASNGDGYALCHEVNPKNGRRISGTTTNGWYWLIYLDGMCGHKLYRVTHTNFKTNQYIAYLK